MTALGHAVVDLLSLHRSQQPVVHAEERSSALLSLQLTWQPIGPSFAVTWSLSLGLTRPPVNHVFVADMTLFVGQSESDHFRD